MKKLLLVLLIVSLLVLSACGGEKKGETTASLVTDMAKAFMLNVPYKCVYKIENVEATSYIKGEKKIKSMTTTPMGEAHSLILDDMLYSWDPATKKGIKLKLEEEMMQDVPKGATAGAYALKEQAQNVECSPEKFGDEMFAVPTDVEFQDLSELMTQMQEQMAGMMDQMPEEMEEQMGDY
jgi:hypothetical protein